MTIPAWCGRPIFDFVPLRVINDDEMEWHEWFSWYPVHTVNGSGQSKYVWLEHIFRRGVRYTRIWYYKRNIFDVMCEQHARCY